MRLAKRPTLLLLLCGALGLAACGGGDDSDDGGATDNTDDGSTDDGSTDDGGDDGATVNPDGEDNTYVISELTVPANANEADAIALDIDGDGDTENALGGLLGTISSFVGDIPAVVQEQVDTGGIILLANLKATDLTAADGVGLYVYLGANPNPPACASEKDTECGLHLQGDATFEISPDSPTDAVIVGSNAGGAFTGGPGEVTIELSLSALAEPLTITLVSAQSTVDVSADALTGGKLGGAITIDSINNDLLPAVAVVIEGILADEKCDIGAAPDCCPEGSTGRTILMLLDEGFAEGTNDCVISGEELAENALVSSTIGTPDVDLDPAIEGNDAISLGVGFSAVPGTFTPPAP